VIAMSGGVDSSVAAARLVDAGWDVVGVTLHLWDSPDPDAESRCCAPEDQRDARRVADALGFPHYTFDRRELFRERVVAPFVDAYLEGRTPSPCVACNEHVKVRELVPLADKLGARFVATGHYARIERDETGKARLHRGKDRRKDQSYFLHVVSDDELERVCFPLGDLTKEEVRADALARGLPGATKGESQELCFIGQGRYAAFVEERAAGRARPGAVVDDEGRTLGTHDGVHRFTVGQRKGLGVQTDGRPLFVRSIDARTGLVMLGSADGLASAGAVIAAPRLAGDVGFPFHCEVQVRYRTDAVAAVVAREIGPTGVSEVVARFAEPVRAVSPGQVAVFYRGDRVLGGGPIERSLPVRAPARAELAAG
jgi:tRNA-specific 2-thiouridylase